MAWDDEEMKREGNMRIKSREALLADSKKMFYFFIVVYLLNEIITTIRYLWFYISRFDTNRRNRRIIYSR